MSDSAARERRLRAACAARCTRCFLVLEKAVDSTNLSSLMRTADACGVQDVWIVKGGLKNAPHADVRGDGPHRYLSVRTFEETSDCISALRARGVKIWVSTLAPGAVPLESSCMPDMPEQVCLVVGREADGVSKEMSDAADKCESGQPVV